MSTIRWCFVLLFLLFLIGLSSIRWLQYDHRLSYELFLLHPNVTIDSTSTHFTVNCLPLETFSPDWCLDESLKWRYIKDTKTRWTYEGAVECLKDKHILLIGDSRTRYQYFSLATFLATKSFPSCSEGIVNKSNYKCTDVMAEKYNWNVFCKNSNRLLNTNLSKEAAYCYQSRDKHWLQTSRQNRFLYLNKDRLAVTFIQSFDGFPYLEKSFPPFQTRVDSERSCRPGECVNQPNEIKYTSVLELLNKTWDLFEPTHVFVTTGWHQEDIGCQLQDFQRKTNISTWMITGPRLQSPNWVIKSYHDPQGCGNKIFDRTTMTQDVPKALYIDEVHVSSSINEEYNHFLLDLVC